MACPSFVDLPYVAYGSNLHLEDMKKRCPDAIFLKTGFISDYTLVYRGPADHVFLNIERKPGSIVPVGLFKISEQDLQNLDIYEEVPDLYYRDVVDVFLEDGSCIQGLVYIMHDTFPLGTPSEAYVQTVKEGYEDHDFTDLCAILDKNSC